MAIKKTLKAKEQDREDIKIARTKFAKLQSKVGSYRFVCLDESNAKTNMTRLYGRARNGSRCFDSVPHGNWKALTMLSSIRSSGETECFVFDGATNRKIFELYIETILCPTLRAGDIVVMDNLSSHKSLRVKKLIKNKNAHVLYLPAYSPDLNPIEKMWSKVKAYLRKVKADTIPALIQAIKEALESVSHNDAKNWFKDSGFSVND